VPLNPAADDSDSAQRVEDQGTEQHPGLGRPGGGCSGDVRTHLVEQGKPAR